MRKSVLAFATIMLCLGLTSLARAQDKPKADGSQQEGPPPMLRPNVLGKELGLSDAQKQQVEEILRKARTDAQAATDPQAKHQIWQAAGEQISKNVLNDQQRAKFAQLRQKQGWGAGRTPFMEALEKLNLTADQKAKAKEIMHQAHANAEQATDPQGKRQAIEAGRNKVRTEVLTEQQRQQLDQILAQSGGHGAGQHKVREHAPAGKHAPASRPA